MAATAPNSYRLREYNLPPGDPGVAKTIGYMNQLVIGKEGVRNGTVRATAIQAASSAPGLPRDPRAEVDAVFQWVKQNIQFRGEYGETLQTPLVTLQLGAGDCDDQSVLLAALLRSLGFKVRFKTVAADKSDPKEFTHVLVEVQDKTAGQWVSLDSTVKGSSVGWTPPNVSRTQSWKPLGRLRGLGFAIDAPAPPNSVEGALLQVGQQIGAAAASRIAGPYGLVNPSVYGASYQQGKASMTASVNPLFLVFGIGLLVFLVARR